MTTDPKHDWRNAAWIAFLVTLFALAVAALSAKPASAAEIADTVVQIGGCSGVCVDPSGIVLTVKHCGIPEVTQVRFRDRTVMARKLYETTECDGPVVFDCEGEGYPYQRVAQRVPNVGEDVWSAGYPARNGTRQMTWASGKVVGAGRWKSNLRDCGVLVNEASFATSEGWSGGPLFNQANEVCGLLLGGDKRTSFYASFSAVRAAYDATRPQESMKPTLYVFTSKSCQPCTQFKNDYQPRGSFRTTIDAAYNVQFVDIDQQPQEAARRGVRDVPAFVRDGHANIVGYTTPDALLVALGLKDAEAIIERPAVPITPSQNDSDATPSPPTTGPASPSAPPGPPQHAVVERLDVLVNMLHAGMTIASCVGIGFGTWGIGSAVLWGLSAWRAARKVKQVATDIGGYWLPPAPQQQPPQVPPVAVPQRPPVITTENPPPPQAIIQENTFVPYERDTFAEAFAWAERQAVTKYPGSSEVVQLLRSLVNQFLASKGIRPKA